MIHSAPTVILGRHLPPVINGEVLGPITRNLAAAQAKATGASKVLGRNLPPVVNGAVKGPITNIDLTKAQEFAAQRSRIVAGNKGLKEFVDTTWIPQELQAKNAFELQTDVISTYTIDELNHRGIHTGTQGDYFKRTV